MAELENGVPSSVTHLPDEATSGSSGSGTSEVNKGASRNEKHYQTEQKNGMPSSNVSNNFKTNNGFPLLNMSDLKKFGNGQENQASDSAEIEVQENKKNELMSQQLSSPDSSKDVCNDKSVECKNEKCTKKEKSESKGGKKKREIRFPDDSCISDCLDPPDPWRDAPVWTTDELISAYKKSCDINSSKPVVKILQQLHGISTPGKRFDSFVVKGEKLDQRQVECIEEIFRRVQFHLIDLEATHLDDECAVALFEMIEHYESACQLNISFNRSISARGWQACSRLVRRTPSLTFLDMRNCDLNERTIPIFGRALKMGCHLTVLHMEGMSLTSRPLIILVAALKMNTTLQELFLAENKLVPTDGVQLGNLLRYNHRLNLLDLRNNNLQDVGVIHLCDGLVEQKSGHGLHTLVLWNNQISYQAMQALGQALAVSTSLETLNIGHNGVTNEGVHLVKDGLLKTSTLLRLGLQGTRISDEGAVALAEFIADSNVLLRIDLRDNDIKTGGLMALSHAMRVNNSVTRIDIDKETKKESGMKDYAEVQIRLLRDILTFQERNVQLVMEREEAERARLEQMALQAEAARQRDREAVAEAQAGCTEAEDTASPLAAVTSNTESFTIIEAESCEPTQEVPVSEEPETGAVLVCGDREAELPSLTFSEEEEQTPACQRPSVLFARMGLQPQEALDSPRTPTAQSHVFQPSQEATAGSPKKQQPSLPLNMPDRTTSGGCTPPGEMLLSPQYYPKQLARKIFSVSRVSETGTSPPVSPSEEELCDYDPLNVSLVSLIPVPPTASDPSMSTTSCHPILSSGAELAVSPTTLCQDMANETVKQIVSEVEEEDPSAIVSNTLCLSSSAGAEVKNVPLQTQGSELVAGCDTNENYGRGEEDCDVLGEESVQELLGKETAPELSALCYGSGDGMEPQEVELKDSDDISAGKGGEGDLLSEEGGEWEKEQPACVQDEGGSDDMPCDSVLSTVDTCVEGEGGATTTNIVQPLEPEQVLEETASQSNNVIHSDSEGGDVDISGKDCSVSLCDSPVKTEDASLSETQDSGSDSYSPPPHINQPLSPPPPSDHLAITEPSADTEHVDQEIFSIEGDDEQVGDEGQELQGEATAPDVDLDGVELNLEEEPWTSVESEDHSTTQASASHPKGAVDSVQLNEEKQPDFFTTLSMNGLTQELASALTSLDGAALDVSESQDTQSQDDFEKELDALVAEVQNAPPSALTN